MRITYGVPIEKRGYKEFLKKEIAQARNIKSKQTREQVITGLTRMNAVVEPGYIHYWNGEFNELERCEYGGKDSIYHCGKEFVFPQRNKTRYLLVAMDANECTIGMLEGKRINTIWNQTSNVPRKHNKGGQSKARFQRARQEALKQWYKKIANKLKEIILQK